MKSEAQYDMHWSEVEKLIGQKVDRRRKYALINNELCERAEWTTSCSGCFECGDYGQGSEHYQWDEKNHCYVGSGCPECGYHGKIRQRMWVPSDYAIAVRNSVEDRANV